MAKILVTEPEYFPNECITSLESLGTVIKKRFTEDELLKEVEDADALLIRIETRVDKKILDHAQKLKIIASATTDLSHIDLKYAEEKGVKVFGAPGINSTSTAEHTFALLLSLVRKIPWSFVSLRNGEWQRFKFFGKELQGKILGVIGFGRIGKRIAKYAQAFEMKVLTYDPYVAKETADELGVEMTSLEKLISNSDFITVNVALTPETENMISKDTMQLMRKSAIIVNTSRGVVINETDLIDALKNGTIAGAALDVFSAEPLSSDNLLVEYARNYGNLLITPHIGGSTEEAIRDACMYVSEKVKEYLQESSS